MSTTQGATEAPTLLGTLTLGEHDFRIMQTAYTNGRNAIYLMRGGQHWTRISVNVPDANIPDDMFLAKTVDENETPRGPLLETGLFEAPWPESQPVSTNSSCGA